MSCIVSVKHQGKVWMGGDSRGNGCFTHVITKANAKVFRLGPMLIGHVWSPRTAQILRYTFEPPAFEAGDDPMRYLVADFALPLREQLVKHGAAFDETNEDDKSGDTAAMQLLIALDGRLFQQDSNFQIMEFDEPFSALGSGMGLALGALHALSLSNGESPERQITIALEAASRFDTAVGPPFIIESI